MDFQIAGLLYVSPIIWTSHHEPILRGKDGADKTEA